jgi:hypothetical protein
VAKRTELTALQIIERIKSASEYNREEVAAAFIGRPFSETLFFDVATRIGGEKENMLVFFRVTDDNLFNSVTCVVPTKGHEHLPASEKTDRFRVRGTIERASKEKIDLKDASIEPLQD